jgi:hypothetical protein
MKKWMMAVVAISMMAPVATPLLAQTMPVSTPIYVTLDQSVSSKTAKVGQILSGTVSQNVVVDGKPAIPKGSNANVEVASVQASGRLSTPAKLYVRLDSNLWGQIEGSKAKRDAVGIGGGAAAGAVIGAIAGGGKGAAIGTAVGAGAGAAGTAATGKKDITFPAETKIKFATKTAITIK